MTEERLRPLVALRVILVLSLALWAGIVMIALAVC